MSLAIIGSSHVCKLKSQLYGGYIYPNGIDERLPNVEWFGISATTAAEMKDPTTTTRLDISRHTRAKVACLIMGSNDMDDIYNGGNTRRVFDNIKLTVEGIQAVIPLVMVVPLFYRQYPRTHSCPFRQRYPGRCDYNMLSIELNKSLVDLKEMGVRIVTKLNLKDSDLYDCVYMLPTANRRLLNTILRCYKHMLNTSVK